MKNYILSACLLLSASAATAQDVAAPLPAHRIDVNRLRFGAFVAPNISWMKPTTSTDDNKENSVKSDGAKLGFTYGLMAEYFFAPNYGLVTGLSITNSGGKILTNAVDMAKSGNKVLTTNFNYNLQYLEIPLALKLRSDDINGLKFFGQLGLTAAINISKKADYTVTYYDKDSVQQTKSDTKAKITGDLGAIAPVMFQMNVGAGVEVPVSYKLRFYAGLFFNNGFWPDATKPDLYDAKNLGYSGIFRDANTRLNNFALRLGLFF